MNGPTGPQDPVRARRRRIARAAEAGQRLGYALFALATAVFVTGFLVGFTPNWVRTVVALLAAGSIVLAPSIVAGYAAKAAEREDLERGR